MLEPWRSDYLHAMGVDIYAPKFVLPGAGPSILADWDESSLVAPEATAELVKTEQALIDTSQRAKPAAPAVEGLARSSNLSVSASNPARQSSDNVRERQMPERAVRIELLVATSDAGILIVDDMPSMQWRPQVMRLLGNLLYALERKASNLNLEFFEWPLPTLQKRQAPLDESAARETLNGFLAKKLSSGGIDAVYLLGDNANHWVSAELRSTLAAQHPICWCSSVGAMDVLRDPPLKVRWWKTLRSSDSSSV